MSDLFEGLKTFPHEFELTSLCLVVDVEGEDFYFGFILQSNGYYCTCNGNHIIGSTMHEAYMRMLELVK
jgi:hypothetical protein